MRKKDENDMVESPVAALSECRTMISAVGILFGFLLSSSIIAQTLSFWDKVVLATAMLTSVVSIGVYAMPVIYHHLQFPYKDKQKFILRTHHFLFAGFLPFALTLLLSSGLVLKHLFGLEATPIALLPLLVLGVVYWTRRKH